VTFTMVDSTDDDYLIAILDYWTDYSLEAYWKELVRECNEINNTGHTDEEYDTGYTN